MSRRGLVINTLVALIAILITGGLAAQAVIHGPRADGGDSKLVAAGADGRDSVAIESPSATAATRPTASTRTRPGPATTTPPPQAAVTAATAVTTAVTVPPAPATSVAPAPSPATTAVPPPPLPFPMPPTGVTPPTPAPTTVRTGPASWRLEDNGVTVTAHIEPAAPHVGDTVTVSYTTTGEGDFCCWVFVYADGAMVGENQMPHGGPCPLEPVTDGSASVVVSEPGPFTIQVQGTRVDPLCVGPPTFHTANLFATFPVLPA
jgi:hypothetical protein